MSISGRMILGFVAVTALLGFLGYLSIRENVTIINQVVQITKSSVIQVKASTEMYRSVLSMRSDAQTYLIARYRQTGPAGPPAAAPDELPPNAAAQFARFEHYLSVSTKSTQTAIELARESRLRASEIREGENLKILEALRGGIGDYRSLVGRFYARAVEDPSEAEDLLVTQCEPLLEGTVLPLIRRFSTEAEKKQVEQILQIERDLARANRMLLLSTAVCLLVSVLVGFFISRSISVPLRHLKQAVLEIGRGRMPERVIGQDRRDELGILAGALSRMVKDLSETTVSKSYVDNIIRSMADPLLVLDARCRIQMANQAALDLLGYDAESLRGRPIGAVVFEESQAAGTASQMARLGLLANVERTLIASDGRRIPAFFSSSPLQERDGPVRGMVCVAKDMTELKRMHLELKKARDELEMRVRERTAELARANEALGEEIREREHLEKEILDISERERRDIGQDLHDGLGQCLTGIALMLRALHENLQGSSERAAADAERIESLVNDAIAQTKMLVRGLCPVDFERGGIVPALEALAEQVTEIFQVACRVEHDGEPALRDHMMASHLYRIAQEAVSNAIKHGKAEHVLIEIGPYEGALRLRVTDDGVGFAKVSPRKEGMGLSIMRYRAKMIAASLQIENGPQGGTIVTCTLPGAGP